MADVEFSSFVKKFQCLRHSGYDASLNVESKLGEIFVTLSCKVGRDIPPPSSPPSTHATISRNRSPSYFRRQERRRQAFRRNLSNVSSSNSTAEQVAEEIAVVQITEAQETEEKNAAGQDGETLSESSDNNEAEEADYSSQHVTGGFAEM